MVATEDRTPTEAVIERAADNRTRWAVSLGSLLFIVLQSACTVVMAASGLRLAIGIGAAVAASGVRWLEVLHFDALRIPMMLIALGGSALNLYVIRQIRMLRARPASQWRVRPATKEKLRSERIQIALAVLTIALVAAEEITHLLEHHCF